MEDVKKIGKVTLNYRYYDGNDKYSDGDKAEEEMLEIAKNGEWEKKLHESDKWHILYHFSDIRQNLLEWYPFDKSATMLEIGSGCGAMSGLFSKKVQRVVAIELSERRSHINAYRNKECGNLEIMIGNFAKMKFDEKFDYVMLIGVLEYAAYYVNGENPHAELLKQVKELLKPNGKIFIAIENKMGMKYLNGAKEDHVGECFAGIEDYIYRKVRTFSKPELINLLESNGIEKYSFYYPYPDYKLPETIYSDDYMPKPGEIRLWDKNYDMSRVAFYNDAIMADQICRDDMYDYMSNSFLIITNETDNRIRMGHYTNTRKEQFQTKTVIEADDSLVIKTYLKDTKREYDIFSAMRTKYDALQNQYKNVNYLPPQICDNRLCYDFVEGKSLEYMLYEYRHDPKQMVEVFVNVWNKYYVCDKKWEIDFYSTPEFVELFGECSISNSARSYKYTNLDMLLHNLISCEDEVYCIDYEWIVDFPVPIAFVMYRAARDFWDKYNMYFSRIYDRNAFLRAVGIDAQDLETFHNMYSKFGEYVYGNERYPNNYRKSRGTIRINGL